MKTLRQIFCIAAIAGSLNFAQAQTDVTFYTSMGNFEVELTDSLTPINVDSFLARVGDKFYDGTIFHRVIDDFMIQGGDPTGTGFGGPGYTIPDEFHPSLKNVAGALAMANAGPNTGGSQFYVNLVNNSHLNNKHTVFGMVTSGFSVVQTIGQVPTSASDRPITDVVLDSIRVKVPTSVAGFEGQTEVEVYPNPSSAGFSVEIQEPSSIEVISVSGQVVYRAFARKPIVNYLDQEPRGVYILRVKTAFSVSSQRLILK